MTVVKDLRKLAEMRVCTLYEIEVKIVQVVES